MIVIISVSGRQDCLCPARPDSRLRDLDRRQWRADGHQNAGDRSLSRGQENTLIYAGRDAKVDAVPGHQR